MRPLYTDADTTRESPVVEGAQYRTAYRRDYARLLHSPSFRRLQGKTQLFPEGESDFFRNRLTHSLEVAQIAKSIALRLNHCDDYFSQEGNHIDLDLVETAALAHDLGHPPFGHNGEQALDFCMREQGGFEGNAQSLRILVRLDRKERAESGKRVGLNLTHRTLAAVLKYDKCIPIKRTGKANLVKGYYQSEKDLVDRIKRSVTGLNRSSSREFKTIECQIMDLADDIAYSTYDVEDALKVGFLTPIGMILAVLDKRTLESVMKRMGLDENQFPQRGEEFLQCMVQLWLEPMFDPKSLGLDVSKIDPLNGTHLAFLAATLEGKSKRFNDDGRVRTSFTSDLVNEYVEGIDVVKIDEEIPALSSIELKPDLQRRMKLLKHLTHELVVQAPPLATVEYRGYEIVKEIFSALSSEGGERLLPDDYKKLVADISDELERDRTICDFVAGMTDRYAIEFYGRLRSVNAQTIFKPL